MEIDQLKQAIREGKIEPQLNGVEFKSAWHQSHGKDISAIANNNSLLKGWLVIGVNNDGQVMERTINWLKVNEQKLTNHLRSYLEPICAVKNIFSDEIKNEQCLFVEIQNPQDVVKMRKRFFKSKRKTSSSHTIDCRASLLETHVQSK